MRTKTRIAITAIIGSESGCISGTNGPPTPQHTCPAAARCRCRPPGTCTGSRSGRCAAPSAPPGWRAATRPPPPAAAAPPPPPAGAEAEATGESPQWGRPRVRERRPPRFHQCNVVLAAGPGSFFNKPAMGFLNKPASTMGCFPCKWPLSGPGRSHQGVPMHNPPQNPTSPRGSKMPYPLPLPLEVRPSLKGLLAEFTGFRKDSGRGCQTSSWKKRLARISDPPGLGLADLQNPRVGLQWLRPHLCDVVREVQQARDGGAVMSH